MVDLNSRSHTNDPAGPLTDSPFAPLCDALAGMLPPGPPEQAAEPPPDGRVRPGPPFRVARTRKGGWPVHVERRAGGKTVTIISRVEGDARALLAALRKLCGAGGALRDGAVELQGDHRAKVESFLREN
jgi:translation initiation factor 1